MEQALTLAAFAEDPIGRYLVGAGWLHFRKSAHVAGCVLWGRLTEKELARPTRLVPVVQARSKSMFIVDARRVEHVEAGAFTAASDYVKRHRRAIESATSRLAIVYAHGLPGAAAAGFFRIVRAPCQVDLFTDPLEASRWLAIERAAELFAELSVLQATAAGTEPLLRDLRALLGARLCSERALGDVARALHLSQRTLQRRLAERGTSFQQELAHARVQRGQTLLRGADATLTEIAYSVGCASLYHFTSVFKKVTGETPGQWRTRHRSRSA